MKEGGTDLHKTIREINLVYKGLSAQASSLSAFVISKTHISGQKPQGNANWYENDIGMRLCKFTLTIIPSLPCLHTFWHAIPTYRFTFLMFF